MSASGQAICRLAEEAAEAGDPEEALRRLTMLRDELVQFERQQVARALTEGRSFGTVAGAMGISRQAVHHRFRDLSPSRRLSRGLPPTPEVRLAFDYARAEAKALGVSVLAPAHMLLGILRNGDRRAAGALASAGVTLEAARRDVGARSDGGLSAGRLGRVDVRTVLADSVQCARRRNADRVEVEHLLRAALADGSEGRALLERLGASPAGVLAALDEAPGDDCLQA
jgi:ATP-dependent Clp protease ATP-binding subunit ClpA